MQAVPQVAGWTRGVAGHTRYEGEKLMSEPVQWRQCGRCGGDYPEGQPHTCEDEPERCDCGVFETECTYPNCAAYEDGKK